MTNQAPLGESPRESKSGVKGIENSKSQKKMNDLIKGAVRQKNITNKNQMPEWMKREQERAAQKKVDTEINYLSKD